MAAWLKIEDFFDSLPAENVMAAANTLIKSQVSQQRAEISKFDVRVGRTPQHAIQRSRRSTHNANPPGFVHRSLC